MSHKDTRGFPDTEISPSPGMAAILIVMHIIALTAAVYLMFTDYTGASAFAILPPFIAWSLIHHLRLHAWRSLPRSVVGLRVDQDGDWRLRQRDGTQLDACLMPDSLVHPWVLVLNFRVAGKRVTLLIVPDAMDQERMRRLRVRLLTAGAGTD